MLVALWAVSQAARFHGTEPAVLTVDDDDVFDGSFNALALLFHFWEGIPEEQS